MLKTISSSALNDYIQSGRDFYLVEALPPKYFVDGHLPGAINIPHDQMSEYAASKLPDVSKTVVVYCASTACQNSRIAAQWLEGHGYENVLEFVGGKEAWTDEGYSLVKGEIAA